MLSGTIKQEKVMHFSGYRHQLFIRYSGRLRMSECGLDKFYRFSKQAQSNVASKGRKTRVNQAK